MSEHTVTLNFMFSIGDEITMRAMASPFGYEPMARGTLLPSAALPKKLVVVGHIADSCVAGWQQFYKVRVVDVSRLYGEQVSGFGKDYLQVGESEVMAYSEACTTVNDRYEETLRAFQRKEAK